MEKNSIATSVEQSKQLLKMGIAPNTASMSHDRWEFKGKCGYTLMTQPISAPFSHKDAIPAWNLGDLISILPNKIAVEGLEYSLELTKDEIRYVRRANGIRRHRGYVFIGDDSNSTLIDIAVKAIVTLKKKGII